MKIETKRNGQVILLVGWEKRETFVVELLLLLLIETGWI
jgi:hypothetical protein